MMTTQYPSRRPSGRARALVAVVTFFVLGVGAVRGLVAQEESGGASGAATGLAGRVEDQAGQPVANLPVALHRLDPDGNGIELAQTVTDDGGEFRFSADFTADGIYFVATRYDNVIYVGIPFHPPGPPEGEYVVLVGDPSMGLQLGGPLPEEAMLPDRPADLPLAGIAFAVLTLAGFLTLAWRDGARGNWRRDVLRLAELEEAYADGQDDTVPEAERDLYEKRRQQLWEQLLRRTGAG